ncbi:MAG: hypothetical protein COV67_02015 [Nitrospinae bacterium CG11_big_fil_rev_8_21_14_0_20_56_8]|nr:MAG: hypothetical protein COV67_02015 [Nitrospinae bacterium CG11_big_fil_rev_8_21_14_0_20_56_8]
MNEELTVLNKEAALEICDGDEDLFNEIAVVYRDDAIELARKLKKALEGADAHGVERAAHALKGASGNICAERVRELAYKLEQAGRNKDLRSAVPLYKEFVTEFIRLKDHLDEILPP